MWPQDYDIFFTSAAAKPGLLLSVSDREGTCHQERAGDRKALTASRIFPYLRVCLRPTETVREGGKEACMAGVPASHQARSYPCGVGAHGSHTSVVIRSVVALAPDPTSHSLYSTSQSRSVYNYNFQHSKGLHGCSKNTQKCSLWQEGWKAWLLVFACFLTT